MAYLDAEEFVRTLLNDGKRVYGLTQPQETHRLLRICNKQKKVVFYTENLLVVTNSLLYKIEILEI